MTNSEREKKTLDGMEADSISDHSGGEAELKDLMADATAEGGVSEKRLAEMEMGEFIATQLLRLNRNLEVAKSIPAEIDTIVRGTVLPVARKLEAIADRLNRAMIEVSEKIAEKVVEKMAGRMPQPKAVQAEKPTNYKPLLIWIGCMLGGILLALGWLIVR